MKLQKKVDKKNRGLKKGIYTQIGAVVIEASIALPVFMFMMFTLYSIIQIAYVQARMTVALDCAAKELAEYAHVYYASKLNESFSGSGGASSEIADQIGNFLETVGEGFGSIDSEMGQFVSNAGSALSGDSLTDLAKDGIGTMLGQQMMKKNLVSGTQDTVDAFMARNHIKNFDMGSNFLESASKNVFLWVNYDIQVIKLLNIDFSFHMSNFAYTEAWGGS